MVKTAKKSPSSPPSRPERSPRRPARRAMPIGCGIAKSVGEIPKGNVQRTKTTADVVDEASCAPSRPQRREQRLRHDHPARHHQVNDADPPPGDPHHREHGAGDRSQVGTQRRPSAMRRYIGCIAKAVRVPSRIPMLTGIVIQRSPRMQRSRRSSAPATGARWSRPWSRSVVLVPMKAAPQKASWEDRPGAHRGFSTIVDRRAGAQSHPLPSASRTNRGGLLNRGVLFYCAPP